MSRQRPVQVPSSRAALLIGLLLAGSFVAVDPAAIALINVEFLAALGSAALAMSRVQARILWHRVLVSNAVVFTCVGWRMTREDPRTFVMT